MDELTAIFVEGMGAAAATSGVLTKLEGRIFGLLYMHMQPLSLDEISQELQQSKSNVSVQIRDLLEWQLVRQIRLPGSRKDHYEAATDFWRVMQEVMERRFRWNMRQVLATAEETLLALAGKQKQARSGARNPEARARHAPQLMDRLTAMRDFFAALDTGISAMSRGEVFVPDSVRQTLVRVPIESRAKRAAAVRRRLP
jgi:DNA-binding transcriptional regulator GbsR (MarR family)